MAKKDCSLTPGGPGVRHSAVLQEILNELQSPDDGTRAAAVRSLCPCRTAWDIPVQRYIDQMRDDPSSSVRHEVHHVLDEDSRWGKKLEFRKVQKAMAAWEDDGATPCPH